MASFGSSAYIDATSGSVNHCHDMSKLFPNLSEQYYDKIATYCQQKLWHQLTLLILDDFMNHTNIATTLKPLQDPTQKNTFLAMYINVVQAVQNKLNPLALSQIASRVAFVSLEPILLGSNKVSEDDWNHSKSVLDDALKKVESKSVAAKLYLESQLALLLLQKYPKQPLTKEQLDSIKSTMKQNEGILNQLMPDTPESTTVHSSYYEMSMTYYKLVGPPEMFYDQAMLYLNYYNKADPNDKEAVEKQHLLAVDLCLAAITGQGVYNLGQLVTNPLVGCLQGTPEAWLTELLQSISAGNVTDYKNLVNIKYKAQIEAQPTLVHRQQAITEKMTLLSLVQLVFERPSSERTLSYDEIATRLQIAIDQVEWVIMRAFSEKLLEGSMDQVDGTVTITWVLPRMLDNAQLSSLSNRFGEWAVKVSNIKDYMKEQQPSLTT